MLHFHFCRPFKFDASNYGKNIILSDDNREAQRKESFDGANVVMNRRLLRGQSLKVEISTIHLIVAKPAKFFLILWFKNNCKSAKIVVCFNRSPTYIVDVISM